MRPTQSEYYISHKLHPSAIEIDADQVLQRHWWLRVNLYQNRLAVPVGLFGGQHVLEVGCGTGENALVFAALGANVTLVDADPTVEPKVDEHFGKFGLRDRIRRKVFRPFDTYEDDPIFSLATAEGFLFTLRNRDDLVRRMISVLRPGGIAVISFPDRFGTFVEFIKKAVMWRVYQLSGLKDDEIATEKALGIARPLFEPAFLALKSTRDFRTWWLDCLVSPFLTWEDCWSYSDLIDIAWNAGAGFHASTPRIYEWPALSWYKAPWTPEQHREAVLESYRARQFDLLFGRAVNVDGQNEGADVAAAGVERILTGLTRYFGSLKEPLPELDFAPVSAALVRAGVRDSLLPDFTRFFEILRGTDPARITAQYAALAELPKCWGSSYQYIALAKHTLPPSRG